MQHPIPPAQFAELPDETLVRLREIISSRATGRGVVPFGRLAFLRAVKRGEMPAPVAGGGGRMHLWRVGDVREALAKLGGAA